MKPDLYTKAVLTIIAASLVYLCFGQPAVLTGLLAQSSQPTPVVLVGWSEGAPSGFQNLGNGLPIRLRFADQTLPVSGRNGEPLRVTVVPQR